MIFFPMRSVEAKNVRTFAFGSYKRTEAIEEKEQNDILSRCIRSCASVHRCDGMAACDKNKNKKNRVRLVHRDKE